MPQTDGTVHGGGEEKVALAKGEMQDGGGVGAEGAYRVGATAALAKAEKKK